MKAQATELFKHDSNPVRLVEYEAVFFDIDQRELELRALAAAGEQKWCGIVQKYEKSS